jgi:cytoskeleton protein RodZ
MTDFGPSFRKARESLGVPLEKIAAETRISTRFLRAIENEDFHLLPGGIFNRGFIRAYAQRVGLDPERAVADYERISSTTQQPVDAARHVVGVSGWNSDNALYFIAIGVLVVLIAIFYFANRSSSTESPPPGPAKSIETRPTPPAPAPVQPQSPNPSSQPAAQNVPSEPTGQSPLTLELDARGVRGG